jgi:hypothetical protein
MAKKTNVEKNAEMEAENAPVEVVKTKTEKTPLERMENHIANVLKDLQRVDEWTEKLTKGLESNKYPLSAESREKVIAEYDAITERFHGAMDALNMKGKGKEKVGILSIADIQKKDA